MRSNLLPDVGLVGDPPVALRVHGAKDNGSLWGAPQAGAQFEIAVGGSRPHSVDNAFAG